MKKCLGLCVVLFGFALFDSFTTPMALASDQVPVKTSWGVVKAKYRGSDPAATVEKFEERELAARPFPSSGPSAITAQTTGYQAYRTSWQWDWKGPHFTITFRIPHSTYSITRSAGIPTSCCEGGINNWNWSRRNLGNGWDDYTLLIPKTLRSQYWYISDWDFSRYFWIWCTRP